MVEEAAPPDEAVPGGEGVRPNEDQVVVVVVVVVVAPDNEGGMHARPSCTASAAAYLKSREVS
jgi:hypothetical protein